jgi:hypothetical protein
LAGVLRHLSRVVIRMRSVGIEIDAVFDLPLEMSQDVVTPYVSDFFFLSM